jgi:hypothetical protein
VTHTFYQGVLCLKNVTQFHGARISVMLVTPVRKVRSSLRRIYKIEILSGVMCRYSRTRL